MENSLDNLLVPKIKKPSSNIAIFWKRKKIQIIIGVVVFLLGITAFFVYSYLHAAYNQIFIPSGKSVTLGSLTGQEPSNVIDRYFYDKKPFNILLVGYGGGNHAGAYLTDSIMVAHIDPGQKKVVLLSIPRDLWVNLPISNSGSYYKINAAYAIGLDDQGYPNKPAEYKGPDGGGHLAEAMLTNVTGLPIDSFVGIDFSGFKHTIDTLGGVDINVETAFDDYDYPIDGKEYDSCGYHQQSVTLTEAIIQKLGLFEASASASPSASPAGAVHVGDQRVVWLDGSGNVVTGPNYSCRYMHVHFNTGLQHMDGATALEYVRSRHSLQDGSDFGRAKRQRNLIVAVKQKVMSASFITQAIPFMTSLKDDLRTDLSLDDVKALIGHDNELQNYKITTLALTNQNFLKGATSRDGQDILIPQAGQDNYTQIQQWIDSYTDPKAVDTNPIVEVENGTRVSGLANTAAERLRALGLNVLAPQSAPSQNISQTSITLYQKNIDSNVVKEIEQEFNAKSSIASSSADQSGDNPYDILVTVGQDYKPS